MAAIQIQPGMNVRTRSEQEKDDTELKRLRSTNECYDKYADRWEFYLSAYEGGEDFACAKNLFKHQRENNEDFNDRAKRVHNNNYCETLVDFFTNFIFAESIDREGATNESWYHEFIQDVNKRGDDINSFMREVSTNFQVYGMCYILVDSPSVPKDVQVTRLYEQQNGIRPYWVIIRPDEILDWNTDNFGRLAYAKRCQESCDYSTGERRCFEKYTEFYNDHTLVTVVDVTDAKKPDIVSTEVFNNALGVIPLEVARYKRSRKDDHVGLSFLRDFAYNQREIMNATSMLQEFLYRQAFNILAVESNGGIAEADDSDVLVGSNNLFEYPKGANQPAYISPPSQPADFISKYIIGVKNEMFTRAAQDAMNELFNGQGASGFSQHQSFAKTVPYINTRADELEGLENRLMVLTMKMIGKTWDGKVKYKDRYELTNLNDALVQFQTLCRELQIRSEVFVKTQLKRFVRQFDSKLSQPDQAQIDKQIDDMNFTEWVDVQTEALVGKQTDPGGGTGPQQETNTVAEHAAEAKVPTATKKKKK